jgi:anti-sigma regulatory factor (Ser/Thr protein kinase)
MTAPSDPRVEILSLEVPCDRHAPAIVREELGELEGIGRSLGDGVLVASELVSNAVLHSGCDTDHVLEVRASLSGNRLLISVRDPGLSGRSAEPRRADTVEPGGWGLHIVARPAQRWGAERPSGYRARIRSSGSSN